MQEKIDVAADGLIRFAVTYREPRACAAAAYFSRKSPVVVVLGRRRRRAHARRLQKINMEVIYVCASYDEYVCMCTWKRMLLYRIAHAQREPESVYVYMQISACVQSKLLLAPAPFRIDCM